MSRLSFSDLLTPPPGGPFSICPLCGGNMVEGPCGHLLLVHKRSEEESIEILKRSLNE